jgi:hypothetical protein
MVANHRTLPGHVALEEGRVLWQLSGVPQGRVETHLGSNQICLLAEGDAGGGIAVWVEAQAPFELEIDTGFTTFVEQVPAGRTRYLLTYLDRTDVRQIDRA